MLASTLYSSTPLLATLYSRQMQVQMQRQMQIQMQDTDADADADTGTDTDTDADAATGTDANACTPGPHILSHVRSSLMYVPRHT